MLRHLSSRILNNSLHRTQPATVICNGYMYPISLAEGQTCAARFQTPMTHSARHLCMARELSKCGSHKSITSSSECCLSVIYTPGEVQTRQKSNKRVSDSAEKEEEDDDNDTQDDALEDNDFEAPAKFKVMKMQAASLRIDTIASHALNIGRNRMEEMFLGSSLLLNGEKMKKKAEKMDEGDYVDVIFEKAENQIKVKRVKLLKILPEKTGGDKFIVKVRVWKSLFSLDASRRGNKPSS